MSDPKDPAHTEPTRETKTVNAAAQPAPTADPATTADSTEKKDLNLGQGENANGEQDAKDAQPDFSAASVPTQGGTKILREEGAPPHVERGHVVQQGGGGVVAPSGDALR